MAKFHINSKGEPGKCRAYDRCPFGDDESHYSTKEEAREAYESGQADALIYTLSKKQNTTGVTDDLTMKEKITQAESSDDQALLMELAQQTQGRKGSKIVDALRNNPNASGEVLTVAHAVGTNRQGLATINVAELESHPNFPPSRATNGGLSRMQRTGNEERIREIVSSPDRSYEIAEFAVTMYPDKDYGQEELLAHNEFSDGEITDLVLLASEKPDSEKRVAIAAQSGKFPSFDRIHGRDNSYITQSRPLTPEIMVQATEHNPDEAKVRAMHEKARGTLYETVSVRAIYRNPNMSAEFRNEVKEDLLAIDGLISGMPLKV